MTGIEAEYNSYLESHTRPAKTLRDLLVNRTPNRKRHPDHQLPTSGPRRECRQRPQCRGGAPKPGRWSSIPRPVPSRPCTGTPASIRPAWCPKTPRWRPDREPAGLQEPTEPSGVPHLPVRLCPGIDLQDRHLRRRLRPRPMLATVNYPVTGCISLKPQSRSLSATTGTGPSTVGATSKSLFPILRHRLRPDGDGVGRTEPHHGGTRVRLQSASPHRPTRWWHLDLSIDRRTSPQHTVPGHAAFGQENVVATVLQMGLVAAGIANDGVIMTPHVMGQIRDSQGNLVETYRPQAVEDRPPRPPRPPP